MRWRRRRPFRFVRASAAQVLRDPWLGFDAFNFVMGTRQRFRNTQQIGIVNTVTNRNTQNTLAQFKEHKPMQLAKPTQYKRKACIVKSSLPLPLLFELSRAPDAKPLR